jgi:ribosomal protein S18 acetylase RimI-like enzyme
VNAPLTSDAAALSARPLESALFGVTIAAATPLLPSDVDACVSAARAGGVALLVIRVPSEATATAARVAAVGGVQCDTLVTLARTVPIGGLERGRLDERVSVRMWQPHDASAISALARVAFAGTSGHWHTDPRIAAAAADELYARWAGTLVHEATEDQPVLVAVMEDGTIAGFLAIASAAPDRWHVPLTAVDPVYRGRGVLRRLLVAASARIAQRKIVTFEYVTQTANAAALHAVSRLGFVPQSTRLTYHLWLASA